MTMIANIKNAADRWNGVMKQASYVPPESAQNNAKTGLQMVESGEAGDGLESATVDRARLIAAGSPLTLDHVKRMHSFFERHDKTRPDDGGKGDSPWRTAWELWGGDAGRSWAESVVGQESGHDKSEHLGAIDYDDMRMFNTPSSHDGDQNIFDENSIRGLEPRFFSESNPVDYQMPRSNSFYENGKQLYEKGEQERTDRLHDKKTPLVEQDWVKILKEKYPDIKDMNESQIANYFGKTNIKDLLRGRRSPLVTGPNA